MTTSITTKLLNFDRWIKSLAPRQYGRWLAISSCIVIALLVPWLVGQGFAIAQLRVSDLVWPLSAAFVGFSMVGVATAWRTKHSLPARLGLLLLHLTAVVLFLVPIVVFFWFVIMMSDH